MTKISTSVVIPNWNGKHLLKTCLTSLQKQTLKNFEIIVVDNGSVDGSVEYIKRYFPKVKLITLDKNYGFTRAVNEGIQKSLGNYIVLVNNDTESDKDYLKYLVLAAKNHSDVGFVTGKLLNFYNRELLDSAGDAVDVVGHSYNIGLREKDGPRFNKAGYAFLVTGGGSLFKKEVFKSVGLFDEDYFSYMEDIDLCLRAQFQGFKGWYEPKAVLYHIRKATSVKVGALSEYWHFRNMMQNIIKDYPAALLLKNFNWLKILLVNINTIRFLASEGYLPQALQAEWYILWNLPKLLKKRQLIQKNKKVTDEYIIENFRQKRITFFGLLTRGF